MAIFKNISGKKAGLCTNTCIVWAIQATYKKAASSFMVCGLYSNFIIWPRQTLLLTP